MQTIIKRLLTICLLFSLYSCDIEDNKSKVSDEPTNIDKNMELVLEDKMTLEEYYALQKGIDDGAAVKADLLKRGYPPEKIQDRGYAYVVEDMVFPKKKLIRDNDDNNDGTTKEEQAYVSKNQLINPLFSQRLIRIAVGKSMEAYMTQIIGAMVYWNVVTNTTITFIKATGNTSADYDVAVIASSAKFPASEFSAAEANLPTSGKPGLILRVNTTQFDKLVADKRKLFDAQVTCLAHELGHIIGFHHTDWLTTGEMKGIDITTPNDPNSIMMSGPKLRALNNGIRTGLSPMDKVALQKLYPTEPPIPTITAGSLTSVNFNWKVPAFPIKYTRLYIRLSTQGKILQNYSKYIPPTRLYETITLPYGPNSGCGCPGGLLVEGEIRWDYVDRQMGESSKTAVYFRQGG